MNFKELSALESVVFVAYSSEDETSRKKAGELLGAFTSVDHWKQNLAVLRSTQNELTLHFVSNNLRSIVTQAANHFTPADRAEIRKTLLDVLTQHALHLWRSTTALPSLVDCFSRLQKQCWFDAEEGPSGVIVSEILPFLSNSVGHSVIGISLLRSIVSEMSEVVPRMSYSVQRKINVLFKEKCLFEIFKLGLKNLRKVCGGKAGLEGKREENGMLVRLNLELISQALAFDFTGSAPDPASDDFDVIHLPPSWARVFEEKECLVVIAELYFQLPPPYSTQCGEILEKFCGVSHTLFSRSEDTRGFLNLLIDYICKILVSKKDLDHPQNVHQLARILLRLKHNYQLKQFLETTNYPNFINQVAEFSISVFVENHLPAVYYLLAFWSRMVEANPLNQNSKKPTLLKEVVPLLLKSFLNTQLEHTHNPLYQDTLDSEHLTSIFAQILKISEISYYSICTLFLNTTQNLLQTFPSQQDSHPSHLPTFQNKMSWMIRLITSILQESNKISWKNIENTEKEEKEVKSKLLCVVFECLEAHDERIWKMGNTSITDSTRHLEYAFVLFLQKFCTLYMTSISLGAKYVCEMLEPVNLSNCDKIFERILKKVIMIIKIWPHHSDIIIETLGPKGLFWKLANGIANSKLISKCPLVSHLIEHHSEIDLPDVKGTMTNRVYFYKALGRLLFSSNDVTGFRTFVIPFERKIEQIKVMISSNQQTNALHMLVRVLADLQGLISSIESKEKYVQLFDWIYVDTNFCGFLGQLIEMNCTNQNYTQFLQKAHYWAILKFYEELTDTTPKQRICFPPISANGIKLFRTTAQILLQFGGFVNSMDWSAMDDDLFKSVKLFLRCVIKILSGGYTNFGVFEIYNDTILNDLLKTTCNIIFKMDLAVLQMYPKVFGLVFVVLSSIASYHVVFLVSIESQDFGKLLKLILRGLQSPLKDIISEACSFLDKLFTYHLSNIISFQTAPAHIAHIQKQHVMMLNNQLGNYKDLFTSILLQLFNLILTMDSVDWFVSNPMFGMIFGCPVIFQVVKDLFRNSQENFAKSKDNVGKLEGLFEGLLGEVKMSLEQMNREKFTSNVSAFKLEIKNIMDLNALYKMLYRYGVE